MVGRTTWLTLLVGVISLALPAQAKSLLLPVSIGAGPLPDNLRSLERQTGIELLYDHALVDGLRSPQVEGELTTEAALQQLLVDTNLAARRAQSGAWIVERPDSPVLAQQDAAVAEILVVGRRTQNADIRRFENDVQPYNIVTQAEILRAHRDDINQFFATRITSNTASGLAQNAGVFSAIDIRGLTENGTLVLVDGRRMPSIPDSGSSYRQADINGIPAHAIKRIEVLTGTAGGIHGFSALGGVVNVILDHETRGLDMHFTGGISSRADSGRQGVEASYGRSFGDGRTDLSLFASWFSADSLLVGQRGFMVKDRQRTGFLIDDGLVFSKPQGNSLAVTGLFTSAFEPSTSLNFKPAFGGAVLPSVRTYLPAGFAGDMQEAVAELARNSGEVDYGLSHGDANSDLGANPQSDSLFANFRHSFNDNLEAYADAFLINTKAREEDYGGQDGQAILGPDSPANPFTDYVSVVFPIEGIHGHVSRDVQKSRYTVGVVTALPHDWRGTLEASAGTFAYTVSVRSELATNTSFFLLGDPSDPDVDPFGNWNALQELMGSDVLRYSTAIRTKNQFRNQSLRLAGQVFSTPAGPATLTLLAERVTEDVPVSTSVRTTDDGTESDTMRTAVPSRSSQTISFHGELRTRLFGERAPTAFLRGLELQVAVRRDDQETEFAKDPNDEASGRLHPRFAGTAYTAGAKVVPWSWLTLRGSYATGEQPPYLAALREQEPEMTTVPYGQDPKRGDTDLGTDGPFLFTSGGAQSLRMTRATTASIGAIFSSLGEEGPSLAIDYSRIRRTRDLLALSANDVLAHEDYWPERVTRASMSDADRVLGYSAGPVTAIDTRYMNGSTLEVDAIDARAEWPLPLLGGRLRFYADATYQMKNRQKELFKNYEVRAGFREGPLQRRANGGFDWSTGPLTFGANLQYFGSRLVLLDGPLSAGNELAVLVQGSTRIPSQSYLDLYGSWRLSRRDSATSGLTLDFGIVNILDTDPPRESSFFSPLDGQGFSLYGDPRLQRFELVLSVHF